MKENQRENDLSSLNKLLLLVFVAMCAAAFGSSDPEIKDSWIGQAINKTKAAYQEMVSSATQFQTQAATTNQPPEGSLAHAEVVPGQKSGANQPMASAALMGLSPAIDGVSGSAEVKAGKTPADDMDVTVRYNVPLNQRVCITMTPYETISPTFRGKHRPENARGCVDNVPAGKVDMTLQVNRQDLPFGMMGQVLSPTEPVEGGRDGFVIVTLQVGDEFQFHRIDSPFFARDAVKVAR